MKTLAQAVIGPLRNGLQSFSNVSEMLLNVDADFLLPECQAFHEIRREIEKMKQELDGAEQVAMKELRQVDGETECLTKEQSYLAQQKKEREMTLSNLTKELDSHRSLLQKYKETLETTNRCLRTAQSTLNDQRRRRDEAESTRNWGLGLLAVPIAGWITGE